MCFYISSKHPNEKIATKDIVCYKLLKQTLESPFYCKAYKLNKLYKTNLDEPNIVFGCIFRGFHSYSNKREGFKGHVSNYWYFVKGIIPKGSKYYYNPVRHEYVSNRIILQEIIK